MHVLQVLALLRAIFFPAKFFRKKVATKKLKQDNYDF